MRSAAYGTVRAASSEEAERGARWLDDYASRILETLPGTRARSVEVWFQSRLRHAGGGSLPDEMAGFVNQSTGRVHVRSGGECPEQTVCHELVHALLDESWRALPAILEEGLCEYVSAQIVGGCATRQRANLLFGAVMYLTALGDAELLARVDLAIDRDRGGAPRSDQASVRFTPEMHVELELVEALAVSSQSSDVFTGAAKIDAYHYGCGAWLVERIVDRVGFAGLYRLSLDALDAGLATASVEDVLRAADLGDSERWRSEAIRAIDEPSLAEIVRDSADDLVIQAARWLHSVSDPREPAPDTVGQARVTFGFVGSSVRLRLLEISSFRARVVRELARLRGS